jgi:D-inositol-3-phosphate glycosyltransferase
MLIQRLAMLSVHTSPLDPLGGEKTGGMNVYVREFAQELGKRGIQVDIYTRRSSESVPEIDTSLGENVRVIHLLAGPKVVLDPSDVYPFVSQFTSSLLAFMMKHSLSYDLVYSHYWLSGWVASKLKEISGLPFIQMFHTLGHMKNRIASIRPGSNFIDTRVNVETQVMRWANQIVAATPAEQAQLLWLYRVDRRKVVVIPPGVNLDRFKPVPMNEAKARLGIPDDNRLLLFVGRIEPLKAVDTILQALNVVRVTYPTLLQNLRFAVIGGDLADIRTGEIGRLGRLRQELGLEDVVQFLGAKDQTMLSDYYAASDAVVMPSDYESFGMVALEAMASGTPVIASEVGGLAYLVQNGKTGFLFPARDAEVLAERMISLLVDPERRNMMGQAAAQLAKEYSWSATVDQLLAVFEDVLHTSAARINHRKLL